MKKSISLVLFLSLFSLFSFAETASYRFQEGKLHKSGRLTVETFENSQEFIVKAVFNIQKRSWVPVPAEVLSGEETTILPEQFKDERGYLELEQNGEMILKDAKIRFVKRIDYKEYKNAYQIEVLPSKGLTKTLVTYHPEVKAAGWGKVEIIFISSVPLLNGYRLIAELE